MFGAVVNQNYPAPLTAAQIKKIVTLCQKAAPRLRRPLSIYIVSNAEIKKLNKRWRGKDKATDVLSFVWADTKTMPGEPVGELYVAPRHIKAQAKQWGVSFAEEFTRSFVHGMLHLGGFDHVTKPQAKRMFSIQERLISQVLKTI
jgi:probable rRNA maturation factor